MSNTYDTGDLVRFSATFTDTAGTSTNPTTTIFKYKINEETTVALTYGVDAEVVRDDTGDYHVDLLIDTEGEYKVRWEGTGFVTAAEEEKVYIMQSIV